MEAPGRWAWSTCLGTGLDGLDARWLPVIEWLQWLQASLSWKVPIFINFHPIWSRNGGFSISNQLETHISRHGACPTSNQAQRFESNLKTQRTTDLSPSLVSTTWWLLPTTCLHWFWFRFSGLDLGWSRAGGAVWPRALGVSGDPKWQIWDDLGWVTLYKWNINGILMEFYSDLMGY